MEVAARRSLEKFKNGPFSGRTTTAAAYLQQRASHKRDPAQQQYSTGNQKGQERGRGKGKVHLNSAPAHMGGRATHKQDKHRGTRTRYTAAGGRGQRTKGRMAIPSTGPRRQTHSRRGGKGRSPVEGRLRLARQQACQYRISHPRHDALRLNGQGRDHDPDDDDVMAEP